MCKCKKKKDKEEERERRCKWMREWKNVYMFIFNVIALIVSFVCE